MGPLCSPRNLSHDLLIVVLGTFYVRAMITQVTALYLVAFNQ